MVLNKNVDNFFQETEQVAMAPANIVPGIEFSEDKLLQGRVFAYSDTQMYRLGANGLSLPINRPMVAVNNGNQDGAMNFGHTTSSVNYEPSARNPRPQVASARYTESALNGKTQQTKIQKEQNFKQAGDLYRSFTTAERRDLIENFGGALSGADESAKYKIASFLYKADPEYGTGVSKIAKVDVNRVKAMAAQLQD